MSEKMKKRFCQRQLLGSDDEKEDSLELYLHTQAQRMVSTWRALT